MQLRQRLAAAVMDFFLRVAPPRPISAHELARADWSIQPGGKGLRLSERVRQAFCNRWLRLLR